MDNKKEFAPVVLRVGVCIVYLWFGFTQLINPAMWTAVLPDYASLVPVSAQNLVLINGVSEIILALLLLIGIRVRIISLLLTLHAFHIMTVVGYNAIGVRDFGIFVAVLSVFLYGPGKWTWDFRQTHNQVSF
jgi:uncharacterized membrane protein YphA (DoxX/SURF4 family)